MGRPLRLLHVEDDSYQQFVLTALVEAAWTTKMRELAIEKLMMLSLRRG